MAIEGAPMGAGTNERGAKMARFQARVTDNVGIVAGMTIAELPVGTEVYNNGDMANVSHFGVVTRIINNRFGDQVEITPEADSERKPYRVTPASFSREYKGHGGTRFVTKAAYLAWRVAQQKAVQAWIETQLHSQAM